MKLPRLAAITLVATLATLPLHAGLKEAAMAVPAELAAAPRLSVQGRQGWKLTERLAFGDFTVTNVQRSLTKGSDLQVLFYEGSKRRQTFGFALNEGGKPLGRGAAATNLHRRALESDDGFAIELRNRSGFSARLIPAATPQAEWTLELSEKHEKPLEGALRQGNRIIAVSGTNRLAGTRFPLGETSGYVFTVNNRPVAAVEVINQGAVWLAPNLDADLRVPIVHAAAALLLFEELRPTLPE